MSSLKDKITKLRQELSECNKFCYLINQVLEIRDNLKSETVNQLNEELEKFNNMKIQCTFELNELTESCKHEDTYESEPDYHTGAVRTYCSICGKYLHS